MPALAHVNRTPHRTGDLAAARALLERDGAVIVTEVEPGPLAAVELARRLFAGHIVAVPEAALVREGAMRDRRPAGHDHTVRSNAHTDGYAHGDHLPDHFLAIGADQRPTLDTGEALVIDNYRVLRGRETYEDPDRTMWRVWVWTYRGVGAPDAMLHSDSRFAGAR
jgi:hypothetical protein